MIGIFIGSFNPPTNAHLEIIKLLRKRYEKIVLVPVNSRLKSLISMEERIRMLNILRRKYSYLLVDKIMNDYSYLNYRVIDLLKKKYNNIEIILGSDLLEHLDTFDNYEYLIENYYFMVVSRGKNDKEIVNNKYHAYKDHFHYLEYDSDISSTMVRELIREKKDVKTLIDIDVLSYIKEKHLYF